MLSEEKILENWETFLGYVARTGEGRNEKLKQFYLKHQEHLMLMPASGKKAYHNAFPGGYIDHVNRVVEASLKLYDVWAEMEMDRSTFTVEELIFAAINHDLGKMGDGEKYAHIPSTDEWRKKNLGEMYTFNKEIAFMSVPDRSIFLLTQAGIEISQNEWLAIKLHDGLYDAANEAYLKSYMPETKPRTSIIYILHQADLLAARVEFEREWLPKFNIQQKTNDAFELKKKSPKDKALSSVKSENLSNLLKNL
jgi:hypothetical protein